MRHQEHLLMVTPDDATRKDQDRKPQLLAQTGRPALAAWSGGVPVLDASAGGEARVKVTLNATDPAALLRQTFDCDPSEWLADFTAFRERWRLAGGSQAVRSWLDRRQRHWMRRSKRRRPRGRVQPRRAAVN